MNPSHKQKKSKEPDAPEWWIKAQIDAMVLGTGIVLVRRNQEPEHIPPERYPEVIEGLKWAHENFSKPQPTK